MGQVTELATASGQGAFDGAEWFAAWCEAFADPEAVTGYLDAMPLLEHRLTAGPFALRVLRGPANEHTPWLTPPAAVARDALPRLMREAAVDMVVLPLLRDGTRSRRVAPESALTRWRADEGAPFVDCTGAWDEYWSSRGRKTRSEWARAERRLLAEGFGLSCHTALQGLDAALDDAFRIERDSWKGDEGSAIAQDPALDTFYRRVARDWAGRGLLRLYFLGDDHQRIAFQLCALDHGQLVSLKIGFCRDFARLAPGQALQLMILRGSFEDAAVQRFDLLGPATEHKLKWATGVEQLWTVRRYRAGFRGALAALRWSVLPEVRQRLPRSGSRPVRDPAPGSR